MEFRRLRRRDRTHPGLRTSSPKPIKAAIHRHPVPADARPTAAEDTATPASASSARHQWPNRLLKTLLPSTHRAVAASSLVDSPSDWDPDPSSRPDSPLPTTQNESEFQFGPDSTHLAIRLTQGPTPSSGNDTVRPRKRGRPGLSPAITKTPAAPSQSASPADEVKLFACPFYKLDPDAHQECRPFKLSRVKDVKLHLQRKHSSRGSSGQSCEGAGTDHDQSDYEGPAAKECEGQDCSISSSITEEQWERLAHKYQSRRKPVDEQWKDIWRILFPGREPPLSVYLESDTEEMITRLRAFWSTRRDDITNKTYQCNSLFPVGDPNFLADLFDHVIDRFLTDFETETTRKSSSSSAQSELRQDLPYTDVWEDNESVASTAVSLQLASEVGSFPLDFHRAPQYDLKPTSSWPLQNYPTPHDRALSACPSTDSLHGGFNGLILESEDNVGWVNSCDTVPDQAYYSLDVLGDSMVVDFEPSQVPYRHTWSGPMPEDLPEWRVYR
ncbi:hypothetical protein B0T14DRAFT_517685 [Immersiella caudata]|uniref:Uncharacterized protein n=1 Tax=Immersiella caudata TaxID=314043 RepID=A0AA40C4N7_9PEZI|nr:hypothetical protein B0T14DRAFT_517685 [Immersiella caudata]